MAAPLVNNHRKARGRVNEGDLGILAALPEIRWRKSEGWEKFGEQGVRGMGV